MVGELVYLVIETSSTDATVMSVHATKEGAEAKRDKLNADFKYSDCRYWVDILRIKD